MSASVPSLKWTCKSRNHRAMAGGDSHDHLITAEDRFNIAMAHQ
jgi:hypothetical protein